MLGAPGAVGCERRSEHLESISEIGGETGDVVRLQRRQSAVDFWGTAWTLFRRHAAKGLLGAWYDLVGIVTSSSMPAPSLARSPPAGQSCW